MGFIRISFVVFLSGILLLFFLALTCFFILGSSLKYENVKDRAFNNYNTIMNCNDKITREY